jgi:hypothetical protein
MSVPTLDPASESMKQLRRAAGLLTGVGQASPASTDPGVALLCLAAADDLRRLGVRPPRLTTGPTQIAEAISDALASLAALPDDIFAATPVLDAAANVRAARALLTNSR